MDEEMREMRAYSSLLNPRLLLLISGVFAHFCPLADDSDEGVVCGLLGGQPEIQYSSRQINLTLC